MSYLLNAILLGSLQSSRKTCSLLHGKKQCRSLTRTSPSFKKSIFSFLHPELPAPKMNFFRGGMYVQRLCFTRFRKIIRINRSDDNSSRVHYFHNVTLTHTVIHSYNFSPNFHSIFILFLLCLARYDYERELYCFVSFFHRKKGRASFSLKVF